MCFKHWLTVEHVGVIKYKRGVATASLIQLDLLHRPPLLPVLAEAVHLCGVAAVVDVAAKEEHLVQP